jgi:hypothetical protein
MSIARTTQLSAKQASSVLRRCNRILTVVVCGVFVAAGWSLVAHTGWAAARQYLGAGLSFDHWSDPLVVFGAMVLVAVAGTRLIERLWHVLVPQPVRPTRVPARAGNRLGAPRTPALPDAA